MTSLAQRILVILIPALLTVFHAYPQTGPMGIGRTDGEVPNPPGSQPRLLLWLDGSSAYPNTTNGGVITEWRDKSGNDHHFGATGENRPEIIISGNELGPKNTPVLRFSESAIGRRLENANFNLPGNGYTIYFVLKTSDEQFGLFSYGPTAGDPELLLHNNSGLIHEMNGSERASSIGSVTDNQWTYGGIAWNNSDEHNFEYTKGSYYEGGFSNFSGFTFSDNGRAIIGDIENPGGGFAVESNQTRDATSFKGYIAEIIIYEGRLSRAATHLLNTYLRVKYGLAGATDAEDWDKFFGNYSVSRSYYAPIGIGTYQTGTNAGAIHEARSGGLVLRVNPGEWTQNNTFLCAGPVGDSPSGLVSNEILTTQVPTGVLSRWNRIWEISGNTQGMDQEYQIGFDFPEGISGGSIPQNKENFVLLYRTQPNTGVFTVLPVPNNKKDIIDDEIVFRVSKSELLGSGSQARYFTIGTTDASSTLTGHDQRTWYAYQNGNWNDPNTWTLDASSAPTYVNPTGAVPEMHDKIHIGAGRKVTVTTDLSGFEFMGLHVAGTLDLGTSARTDFGVISGSGLIRCAADNFPEGNVSAFADPTVGGTVELYGNSNYSLTSDLTVNNFKINLNSETTTVTLVADLTVNGFFEVNKGTFTVNNTASADRIITTYGPVLVESMGKIKVSSHNSSRKHKWYFHDDFINNSGEVRFTNRSSPGYTTHETQNIIEAYFVSGTTNQRLLANGLSYFSRIVIDKGTDMTYILTISSNNPDHFKLLGRCDVHMIPGNYTNASTNTNSFALVNGTAEIGPNIFIPLQRNSGSNIYNINYTAQLWVNGGEVTKGKLGGSGNASAIVPYGKIRVSAGTLNAECNSGITLRENGIFQVDGGVVNARSIRTSYLGAGEIGGIIINGGEINVNGSSGVGNNDYTTFCLSYPGNLFRMTGGVLNVTGPSTAGLFFVNSDPQNTFVSGGTINLDISNDRSYTISSRAALWNLNLTKSYVGTNSFKVQGGSVGDGTATALMEDQPLVIRNNFSIGENTTVNMLGDPIADLFVHGNLTIEVGGVLNHNNNTVHFVGSSNSELSISANTPYPFHNIVVDKDLDSRYLRISQGNGSVPLIEIAGNLSLEKGYFISKSHVSLKGNLRIRSKYGDVSYDGQLRFEGVTGRQELYSDGGEIRNMRIDNPDGVTLTNDDLTITNYVQFNTGSFFIGDNTLRLHSLHNTPLYQANAGKFVVCSGNASAGGVEILNHKADQTLNFHIGVSTGESLKYTQAAIWVNSGWLDTGYVRVTPVDTMLSTVNLDGAEDYLNFYWRVTSSDYQNKPNVTHRFRYVQDDVRGDQNNFKPGRVLSTMPFTRSIDDEPEQNHIDFTNKYIYFNGPDKAQQSDGNGTMLVDADYTAGAANRFPVDSSPEVYFSRNPSSLGGGGADWNTPSNWNKLSECGGCSGPYDYHSSGQTASDEVPGPGDIAVIGFDVNSPALKPHIFKAGAGGIDVAQIVFTPMQDQNGNRVQRYSGSGPSDISLLRPTLEISNTAEIIKVAQISGEGALKLKGNVDLGVSDIGAFAQEDSSIIILEGNELKLNYLPGVVPNLFVNGTATIGTNLRVRGNLEIAGNSTLKLNETSEGNIIVEGDLILDKYQYSSASPKLLFNKRGASKSVEILGNVKLLGTKALIGYDSNPPPASSEDPWTPEAINALLWLDAQDLSTITLSNGKVSEWRNKASGSYDATQTDPNKQPEYLNSGINGNPTVKFDGSNDFLEIPHDEVFNMLATQDFEIFSVVYPAVVNNTRRAIYAKGMTSSRDFLYYHDLQKFRLYLDQGALTVTSPSNLAINPYLGWARRQGNSAALYNTIGGSQTASGVAGANNSGNTHKVTIGAAEDGTDRFLSGQIGELILVKRALTEDERKRMEGYLAHKWGIQNELPNGHPYRYTMPFQGQGEVRNSQLIVHGNIIQNLTNSTTTDNGVNLEKEVDNEKFFVNMVVTGTGDHSFQNNQGPAPRLWRLDVDKSPTSTFTFDSDFSIVSPTDGTEKPINLRDGTLVLDHSDIDITLSSGGGDFEIPNTAGLELKNGTARITGNQTGLLLSGKLKISGGDFFVGDQEGQNNYIEYSSSFVSSLVVTDGNLVVGGQIRRNLSNTEGALDFRQSGGNVIVGRYSAPITDRAVLEVVNDGSRFEQTGGTLTFVRGVNVAGRPSLLLDPSVHNVEGDGEIIIGDIHSPSGAYIQNFGIQSSIPLNDLTITSNNSPKAHLITHNLELLGDLTINAGAELNGGEYTVIVHGDILNDGVLTSPDGLLKLVHPVSGTIGGSGVFDLHDFQRNNESDAENNPGSSTSVETDLLIKNDFKNYGGEMDFGPYSVTVHGHVTTEGHLKFDEGSNGLVLNGIIEQELRGASEGITEIDVITIDNPNGVSVPPGYAHFLIDDKLRMSQGVFLLSGNLLEIGENAGFVALNPFSENNMIVTGGTYANYGLLINLPAGFNEDLFIPLGRDRYMPVNMNFSIDGGSSGTTPSSYLIRLNIPEVGAALEPKNVLGMYCTLDGRNIGNDFSMALNIRYHESYVQLDGVNCSNSNSNCDENYIAARIHTGQTTTVYKFGEDDVDDVNNIITFNLNGDYLGDETSIDGDYFAGLTEAIPEWIPVYTTTKTGDADSYTYNEDNNPPGLYDPRVPGDGAPSGAIVIIATGHTLFVNPATTGINFYQTVISEGATLVIYESSKHRLGKVSGEGTLQIMNTGTLPAGDYLNFLGCEGGRLYYQSLANPGYEILSNLPEIRELELGGSGELILSSTPLNVCENLKVSGSVKVRMSNSAQVTVGGDLLVTGGEVDLRQGTTLIEGNLRIEGSAAGGLVNSGNNGKITVERDLEIGGRGMNLGTVFRETHVHGNVSKTTDPTTGSIKGGTDGAKLVFNGPVQQTITGDFTGVHDIPTIEIDNSHGLVIDGNVDITEKLILTDGKVFTEPNNLIKLTNQNVEIERQSSAYSTAFVNGPMRWTLGASSNPQGDRTFPVGKNERYRPLTVANRSTQCTWEVEYNDTIARVEPEVNNEMLPSNPVIETVSIQEYWRVETTNTAGSTNAKIGLSWGDHSAVSTNTADQSKLVVLAYNTGTDFWDTFGGTDFNYNAPVNHGSLKSESNISFGQKRFLTLGSTDRVNPLPVGWLYFKGENRGPDHLLTWATATETNNDYFELERSIDGRSWEFVTRVTGAGHSTTERSYAYTDYGAPFGTVYYRLQQVDFNGSKNFAPQIVSLYKELPEGTFDMVLYPNPTRLGRFNFRMSQTKDAVVEVSISDLSGARLMHKYVQVDGAGVSSPVDIQLKPGIYLVSVIADAKLISKPLVVTE